MSPEEQVYHSVIIRNQEYINLCNSCIYYGFLRCMGIIPRTDYYKLLPVKTAEIGPLGNF